VAFRAKPATRAKADVAINFGGLDSLLNLFDC
jgi:phosphoserine phosphatase